MLFLLFELGRDRYALDVERIVEVLPLVTIKRLPHFPPGVAGIFVYRGTAVPAIDLSELALDRPALSLVSTRIVLATYSGERGGTHVLGLIAERATDTLRCDPGDFATFGMSSGSAPYLGPVTWDSRGLIQRIEIDRLLTETVRALLFAETVTR
jgi:chemotaxis-related protein WspB